MSLPALPSTTLDTSLPRLPLELPSPKVSVAPFFERSNEDLTLFTVLPSLLYRTSAIYKVCYTTASDSRLFERLLYLLYQAKREAPPNTRLLGNNTSSSHELVLTSISHLPNQHDKNTINVNAVKQTARIYTDLRLILTDG